MSQQAARQLRDQPFRSAHDAALVARMADDEVVRPSSLRGLLRWYEKVVRRELPDKLHAPGVWRDWGPQGQGGSRLGSPRQADDFRAYIEGDPRQTDDDGMYRFPVAAALAFMRHDEHSPAVVAWLCIVARVGFDCGRAADAVCRPHDEARALTLGGLMSLWEAYCPRPPISTRRRQQSAA